MTMTKMTMMKRSKLEAFTESLEPTSPWTLDLGLMEPSQPCEVLASLSQLLRGKTEAHRGKWSAVTQGGGGAGGYTQVGWSCGRDSSLQSGTAQPNGQKPRVDAPVSID